MPHLTLGRLRWVFDLGHQLPALAKCTCGRCACYRAASYGSAASAACKSRVDANHRRLLTWNAILTPAPQNRDSKQETGNTAAGPIKRQTPERAGYLRR